MAGNNGMNRQGPRCSFCGKSQNMVERLVAGGMGKLSFEELLDETERRIAEKIALLVQGHIEAEPVDKHACEWCPVANCERRLA